MMLDLIVFILCEEIMGIKGKEQQTLNILFGEFLPWNTIVRQRSVSLIDNRGGTAMLLLPVLPASILKLL